MVVKGREFTSIAVAIGYTEDQMAIMAFLQQEVMLRKLCVKKEECEKYY